MDPIADLLTRIRNAVKAKKREVNIPASKLKLEVLKLLKEEGYIRSFRLIDAGPQGLINVSLKYTEDNASAISGLRRISRPGCRVYCTADSVPKVLDGLGLVIVSTSKGVLSGKACEEQRTGGEVLCSIW